MFHYFKYIYVNSRHAKEHAHRLQQRMMLRVFGTLYNYADIKKRNRRLLTQFLQEKARKLQMTVIKILICPEFYMSKEPIQLEEHERPRIKFVF